MMPRTVTENIGFLASTELKDRIDAFRRKSWDSDGEEITCAEFLRRAADEKLKGAGV